MSISSVSSSSSQISQITQVSNAQRSESMGRAEREGDSDKDDSASSVVNATKPTVNTSGQTIGTTISVTA